MNQTLELKPCPFCREEDTNEIETHAVTVFMPKRGEIWQRTNCNTCGAVGGKFRLLQDENPWNTRALGTLQPPDAGLVECAEKLTNLEDTIVVSLRKLFGLPADTPVDEVEKACRAAYPGDMKISDILLALSDKAEARIAELDSGENWTQQKTRADKLYRLLCEAAKELEVAGLMGTPLGEDIKQAIAKV